MLNDRRNKSAIDTLVMKHNIRVGLQVKTVGYLSGYPFTSFVSFSILAFYEIV